eukprot:5647835-Pyramimonas_sp.AAC.2
MIHSRRARPSRGSYSCSRPSPPGIREPIGSLDALRSALRLYPTPLPATYTTLLYPVLQIKGCRRAALSESGANHM